jgi:SAM-dependent methyltransferase
MRVRNRIGDRLYGTTDKTFSIVECAGCGLMRLEPRPTLEELRRYYPQSYWFAPGSDVASRLEQFYRRLVLRDHVRFVIRALRDAGGSGPVLDVGCGGGLFLRMLQEQDFRVVGLDNSLQAAHLAWQLNGVPVVCADLLCAPLRDGSCAAITMFHVVEHLLDPVGYLRAAARLLRPDGRLILQTPNAASWQFRIFGEWWNGLDVPRHITNYRQQDLEHVLEEAGFDVLRRKHFSLRDNPAGFATSVAPGLDPMARRVRGVRESGLVKTLKDLAHLGLAVGSLPFTLAEAAFGAGSTIMLEARKK